MQAPPILTRRLLMLGLGYAIAAPGRAAPLRLGSDVAGRKGSQRGAIKVLEQAYFSIGMTVVIEPLPLRRALALLSNGELDGDVARIAETVAEMSHVLRVPVPIETMEVRALSRKPLPTGFSLGDARSLTVITQRGVRMIERLSSDFPQRIEANDFPDMLRYLNVGQGSVLFFAMPAGAPWPVEAKGLYVSAQPLHIAPLFHVLHERHAALLPRITQALRAMEASGEADGLRRAAHQTPAPTP
ncbi:MAG TPA: transporter substrate-binding domain-containing protein [Burkholderiaceae bacterium]